MSRALFRSAAVLALAILFWAFFQASKQVAFLSDVNPVADDPYDAVGSFGFQAAGALGLLAVARSLGFFATGDGDAMLARTQLAAVLAVGITLASDAIGLIRHVDVWWGKPGGFTLVALVVLLACITAVFAVAIARGARRRGVPAALTVCGVAAAALLLYPEGTRSSLAGALVAILAGILVLFVPLRFLSTALIASEATAKRAPSLEWVVVAVLALGAGLIAAVADSTEGGVAPHLRAPIVAIFVGFELLAVLIGYALMRGPLELTLGSGLTALRRKAERL